MRKLVFILVIMVGLFNVISCAVEDTSSSNSETTSSSNCGYHNGNQLFIGPQGGCYYINSNGNKTYVDRSECNC